MHNICFFIIVLWMPNKRFCSCSCFEIARLRRHVGTSHFEMFRAQLWFTGLLFRWFNNWGGGWGCRRLWGRNVPSVTVQATHSMILHCSETIFVPAVFLLYKFWNRNITINQKLYACMNFVTVYPERGFLWGP